MDIHGIAQALAETSASATKRSISVWLRPPAEPSVQYMPHRSMVKMNCPTEEQSRIEYGRVACGPRLCRPSPLGRGIVESDFGHGFEYCPGGLGKTALANDLDECTQRS
jgi:hypothetical protein